MTVATTAHLQQPEVESTTSASSRAWLQSVVQVAFGLFVPTFTVVLGYWLVRNVDASKAGALGLITEIPPAFYLAPILLAISFVAQLRTSQARNTILVAHVIALIFLMHGVVSWIEGSPRFPVTYVHIGFIEYIQRTNHALPSLDARMSWPGFFAMGAMLDKVAGTSNAYPLTLWAPLVFNLIYAPLVFSLARTVSTDRRVPWLATWLFFSISWVGQDYYSPQAVNFIFFLAFMNLLLHYFRSDRAALPRGLRGAGGRVSTVVQKILRVESLRPGGTAILPATASQRGLLVAAMVVIYAATVVSHQLTPVFILLELIFLVVLRRTVLRGLPLLLVVLFFGFISYGAVGFWSGHINDIFGGFGQVSSVASQNVGNKVQGHSNHIYVIYGRLALSASLWAVAAFGIVRRLRKGLTDIFVMIGFISPFLVLGGQSYGGEAILRVFLFSLPFAAILAVLALLPVETIKLNAVRFGLIVLAAAVLAPAFMVARFGNEQFEYVSKAEYQGTQQLYALAPPGSQLVGVDPNITWGIEGAGSYNYSVPGNLEPYDDPNRVYQAVAAKGTRSTFLYISSTQLQDIASQDARPKDWGVQFEQMLIDSGRFQLLYRNSDVAIFKLVTPTPGAAI